MSSKVLYPHTPSTPSTPLHTGTTGIAHPSSLSISTASNNLSSSSRPKRAAAIASQAATFASSSSSRRKHSLSNSSKSSSGASSDSSSTLPHTPQQQTQQGKHTSPLTLASGARKSEANRGQTPVRREHINASANANAAEARPMAALPRSKRARRGDLPTENGIGHLSNGGSAGGYNAIGAVGPSTHAALPVTTLPSLASKNSIMMGIDSALHPSHTYPTGAGRNGGTSSSSRGLGSSVREVIGGQEREVFVVDSASPPASSSAFLAGVEKGKRKAMGTPTGLSASGSGAIDYTASASGTSSKRRRKEVVGELHHEPAMYKPEAVRNLYAGNVDPSMAKYSALAPKPATQPGTLSSYRGGYNTGNSYYKQQKNGAADAFTLKDAYSAAPPAQTEQHPIDDSEGHFIVREGEYVTDRYRIVSLLGQGTFGKVVKCKDHKSPRQVAIKIIRAVQKYTDAAQIEIRVLQTLRENDPWNENKCIHLLETFTYRNHVCIVSELLGQSVFDFLKENEFYPFPPRHIWSFAKQLLRSVAFLHQLGLVHTDLKPENILLVNGSYDNQPQSWRANAKKKRVLHDTDIRLIDFGSATFNDEYHSQVVSTRHYRAPEIILQMGWSFPCDAWSIGCILIEFFTGEALFQTHDNLEHLAMMEAVLGPMPDNFRRKAETYRPTYFRANRLNFPNEETARQSKKFVKGMKPLSDTIRSPNAYRKHDQRFRHLLERLLTFDPNQRMRVSDALQHPYFELAEDEIPP